MDISYYLKRAEHWLYSQSLRNQHTQEQERFKEALAGAVQPVHVHFVCTGNICRSAYAHYALKSALSEDQQVAVEVSSAGVATTPGKPADENASRIAAERGVSLASHRTNYVYRDRLERATAILVMEPMHTRRVLRIAPTVHDKIFLTGLLADENDPPIVFDPYGRDDAIFNHCFDILDRSVGFILEQLKKTE